MANNITLSDLLISTVIDDPISIGRSSVERSSVDEAIRYIFQYTEPVFTEIITGKRKPYRSFDDDLARTFIDEKTRKEIIHVEEFRLQSEVCYCYTTQFEITKLSNIMETTPLTQLVIALSQDVFKLGFKPYTAQVLLERGMRFFRSESCLWHTDAFAESITICYSNRADWTTQVLSEENRERIFKETPLPKRETNGISHAFINLYELGKEIDSLSTVAEFGHFYDAIKTLHKSPRIYSISSQEYRLFIRFI